MRSEAIDAFHTTVAPTACDLRDEEALAGHDRRAFEAVRLLQLPHPCARVAAVPCGRDRPQRLTRPYAMYLRPRACARVTREHGPDEHGDEKDYDDATEHVFALWHEQVFDVKSASALEQRLADDQRPAGAVRLRGELDRHLDPPRRPSGRPQRQVQRPEPGDGDGSTALARLHEVR
jgi:hypothetical protein